MSCPVRSIPCPRSVPCSPAPVSKYRPACHRPVPVPVSRAPCNIQCPVPASAPCQNLNLTRFNTCQDYAATCHPTTLHFVYPSYGRLVRACHFSSLLLRLLWLHAPTGFCGFNTRPAMVKGLPKVETSIGQAWLPGRLAASRTPSAPVPATIPVPTFAVVGIKF